MNNQTYPKIIVQFARIVFALLASGFLTPALRAQPAAQNVDNRLLLVFETSSSSKKSMPAVEKIMNQLFAFDMNGQLGRGDTVGVWTFDRHLRAGQFPLQRWAPEDAATIASNIMAFVEHQHYAKSASFDELPSPLNQIVQDSERLTVLIFCDGQSEIHGTPFDAAINRVFQQQQAAQTKAGQPFVVVLRAQLGKYIGATVGVPPAMINFPRFPPLPQPAEPVTAPAVPTNLPPAPKPVVLAPPLIIIGTNVETNLPPSAPEPETTNSQPAITPANPTNEVSAAPTNLVAETNVVFTPAKTSTVQTNAAAPPENSGISGGSVLKIGVALLIVAIVLVIFLIRRARKTGQDSLITRSMDKK